MRRIQISVRLDNAARSAHSGCVREVLRALAPDVVGLEVECGEGAVVLQGRGSLQT